MGDMDGLGDIAYFFKREIGTKERVSLEMVGTNYVHSLGIPPFKTKNAW